MIAKPILVVIEQEGGTPSGNSLELLAAAKVIANDPGNIVAVCLSDEIGENIDSELSSCGADKVILIDDPMFEPYQADAWVSELAVLSAELKPETILFPHSLAGAESAPRLAFRLNTAVVMACMSAESVNGTVHWTRSCYGGNAHEVISLNTTPAIATITAKSFDLLPINRDPVSVVENRLAVTKASDIRARVTVKSPGTDTGMNLENAEIVVSGGGGIGGPTQFEKLGELADLLSGAVGASRVACDLGWCPPSWQVGLSGKTVAPKLYIAIGISGAVHHLAGCHNSGTIVAINMDPEAEIFKSARFGVVADCNEFLPALIQEIQNHYSK
jgi:electron transfer flavoprotein alpha subunit